MLPLSELRFSQRMPRSGTAGSYGGPTFSFLSNLSSPFVASLGAQTVKNLPAMQETPVQFLDWEDPLKEGLTTHSSILASWTEEPGGLQSMRSQIVGHD